MTVKIEDTYAEAFSGYYSEILVTARDEKWLLAAVNSATGFATSCIGCGCEAGIDRILPEGTPDGRIGATLQFWVPVWKREAVKAMESELIHRIGQSILTAPTTAVWNSTDAGVGERFDIGKKLGFFGDGFQKSDKIHGRNVIRIPRMMGEFLIEEWIGYGRGIMGGNLWFFGDSEDSALEAAEKAVEAIRAVGGVVTTFPGGVCASGSKVGSRYKSLVASTNHRFCPTLRGSVKDSRIPEDVNSVSEVVFNGVSEERVREAMKKAINAVRDSPGLIKISAGNYGGKLGRYKIRLKR